MRISELASVTETPLSAVKYYQREGLLPQGEKSAPNQVAYDDRHVQRVRLIKALLGVGGLSMAATKEVIAALDGGSLPETYRAAQHAMSVPRTDDSEPTEESRERVLALARRLEWAVSGDNPGIAVAARALDGMQAGGFGAPDEYLDSYGSAAAEASMADLSALAALSSPEQKAERMVVGSVLGDPLFAGLRRLAQENATHETFRSEMSENQ